MSLDGSAHSTGRASHVVVRRTQESEEKLRDRQDEDEAEDRALYFDSKHNS